MATRLTEAEIRAIGAKIVVESKKTAHVDTGALRRSISFSYVKGVMIFRELFYGQFYTNSMLEKNAIKMVPNGVEWKIIYTEFGGTVYEVGRTRSGRATQRTVLKNVGLGSSVNIKSLISRVRNKNPKTVDNGKETD